MILSGVRRPTSSSCRFPEAFIRMVAILSPSTVRVDCSASWSPASPSLSLSASSSEKHVCNSPISSCSIRISSIKAWTNRNQCERRYRVNQKEKLLKKQQRRRGRGAAGDGLSKLPDSSVTESNCIGLWSWHSNGEQCHAVCATIAQAGAILNPSIMLCSPWAASLLVIFVFSTRAVSCLPSNLHSTCPTTLFHSTAPLSFSSVTSYFTWPLPPLSLSPGVQPSGSLGSCWAPGPHWVPPQWTPSWWKWTGGTPDSAAVAPEPHTDSSASRWSVARTGGMERKTGGNEQWVNWDGSWRGRTGIKICCSIVFVLWWLFLLQSTIDHQKSRLPANSTATWDCEI